MDEVLFDLKKHNIYILKKISEHHFKCTNTGAWRCDEYRYGGGFKRRTYCLPDSEEYDIDSEQQLKKLLIGQQSIKQKIEYEDRTRN